MVKSVSQRKWAKNFFWPSINIFDPIVSKNFGIVDIATTDHEALENCQNLVV